jgi:hypothetical protein
MSGSQRAAQDGTRRCTPCHFTKAAARKGSDEAHPDEHVRSAVCNISRIRLDEARAAAAGIVDGTRNEAPAETTTAPTASYEKAGNTPNTLRIDGGEYARRLQSRCRRSRPDCAPADGLFVSKQQNAEGATLPDEALQAAPIVRAALFVKFFCTIAPPLAPAAATSAAGAEESAQGRPVGRP